MCRNGACLPSFYKCNGRIECPDGSDEIACPIVIRHSAHVITPFMTPLPPPENLTQNYPPKKKIPCIAPNFFKCEKSNKCIHIAVYCDGNVDCEYMEDETDCEKRVNLPGLKELLGTENEQICDSTDFMCKDGPCVSKTKLCDNHQDCPLGEDEGSLCILLSKHITLKTKPKIITLEDEIESFSTNLTKLTDITNFEKILERRRRILIQGIPEAPQNLTPSERMKHDLDSARKIIDTLGLEILPITVRRIGIYKPSITRMLKVVFTNHEDQDEVLRRAENVKSRKIRFFEKF
uniref:Uncharacterized protein n=1 Tax=Acrobeloides nanus TaxID=290746 RepID=A0A914C869_9BILA